jgi:hypothetical protein
LSFLTPFWGHGRRLKIGGWVWAEDFKWDDGPAGMTNPPGSTLSKIARIRGNKRQSIRTFLLARAS